MKVDQHPVMEETDIQEHPQVKQEQVDLYIGPDVEGDTFNNAGVGLTELEPSSDSNPFPSSATASVQDSIEIEWDEADGSSSPRQSHSVEVIVELEQPARDERICRFCGRHFRKDSFLIRHVERSHKGQKAFKCMRCNKEFDQRTHLVTHTRIHTGEKPYKCDFCDRRFAQNSSCIVHMRVHTGEKPYFCKNCGKYFSMSKHLKYCKGPTECKSTPENMTEEKRPFKCSECSKEFKQKYHLAMHMRIHTGEKPFSCDFCGKTFTQSSSRNVHMRIHTGEKPFFCKKCCTSYSNKSHLTYCTGKQNKNRTKTIRCEKCGKTFYTESEMQVHLEVHKSWKQHIRGKTVGREFEVKKPLDD